MDGRIVVLLWMISCYRISDCFQWSAIQQSSHVINSYIGSNTVLPCQFLLSGQEQYQLQQFHLILWSREKPFGSKRWEGLTSKTHITGLNQSLPQSLLPYNTTKYSLTNNSLTISNIGLDDDTQYQCEVKSSFYTTPSVIKVNVVYKPVNTKIFGPSKVIQHKSTTIINCTATANPKPGFRFFHNSKLVQNSTSQHYVINVTLESHEGEYVCIPWNYYGQGPNASLTIQVEDVQIPTESILLSDEMIAVITGGAAVLLIIIVVLAIMCKRFRSDKQQENETTVKLSRSNKDLSGSNIGPGIYGSDASIDRRTYKLSNKDLSEAYIGPGIYGSDANIPQSNGRHRVTKDVLSIYDSPASILGSNENTTQANGKPREPKLYRLDGRSATCSSDT